MNPELPKNPREEMELRLTALLLGELSDTEAAAMREAIAKDPELTKLHDDLRQTIRLVRVAAKRPEEHALAEATQLKLSEERRKKLLTAFAIPPLKPSDRKPKPAFRTRLIEVLAVLAIVALLASVSMPSFVKSRTTAQSNAIINNLRQLDGAKQQWALEQGKSAEDIPTMKDLEPYVRGLSPVSGETYVLGKVSDSPSAEVKAGAERKLFRLPTSGAVLAGELGGQANLPDDGETLAFRSGSSVESPSSSLTKSGTGTLTINGLPVESPATAAVAPQGQSSVDVHSLNVVGHVNLAGKDLNGQPTARVAGKGSQLYLPSKEAAVGDPEYVGVLGRTETTPQLGVPLQGGGRGGGGAGGVSHGHGEFAAKGVTLRADFSDADQLVARTTQPEGAKSYGSLYLGASPATPAPAPLPSASTAPRYYRAKPGAEGIASPSSVADGKKETDDSTWSAGYRWGESNDKQNAAFAIRQAYVAPPPPAATAGTLTINEGAVSDDFTTRTDGDTAKVPVLGDAPLLGRLFRNGSAASATSDSGLLSYNEQTQYRKLNQLGTDLAVVETPQEKFYADQQAEVAAARDVKAPGKAVEKLGEIVLPRVAGAGGQIDLAKRGTTPAVPSRSLRGPGISGGGQVDDALTRDGRLLLEEGRIAEAEERFKGALKYNPQNRAAGYYLTLADEARQKEMRRRSEVTSKGVAANVDQADLPVRKPSTDAPIPQPEIQTSENNFSTFSLNVSDVSFKLAAASLEKGQMPDPASVRTEEFINAFDYRDPEPAAGAPIAFAWERVRYPFAHNRDLLRFSLKTAAAGRQAGRPLNIVLLLDNSGSMERADRVRIIREALRVLASQLQAQDKLSVVTFSRTPRLFADGVSGDKAGEIVEQVGGLTPQGGTNLEDAMNLAYQTALKHYLANGINRVVVLTDGAANLGNVEPESLKQKVEAHRKQGIALDCFGIGWEGYNDDLLEVLSRNGDGRYGFINSPEEAATEFAGQLAGALKVAASDVKVQVEFNPKRVTTYRQIGYAKHQLTKEQFRDNTVDAAEIAAQEAGNALYTVEVNPAGAGPLCTVRVRFKIPGKADYREQAWDVPYTGNAFSLEQSSPAMRLAASASAFSEWLVASPFAGEVTPDRLLGYLSGVPGVYGADARPKKLEWMIRQAKSIEGK